MKMMKKAEKLGAKAKELGGKAKELGGEVKSKIKSIQEKEWAEPTATALKATGAIINTIPCAGILAGAFTLGATVLNPDPSLADLRRAKDEIKDEVQTCFKTIAKDMKELKPELKSLRAEVSEVVEIICESQFNSGMAKVDALHDYFIEGADDLDNTIAEFTHNAAAFQIEFKINKTKVTCADLLKFCL